MSGVRASKRNDGTVLVTVSRRAYPQVVDHWKSQLTGANAKRWGRLWIDPHAPATDERRRDAMWTEGRSTRGLPGFNRDECPGAMFICETQEVSHVEVLCATQNQAFGRDLYSALRSELGPKSKMGWWEVKFRWVD